MRQQAPPQQIFGDAHPGADWPLNASHWPVAPLHPSQTGQSGGQTGGGEEGAGGVVVVEGVAVPAGDHEVRLTYRDASVTSGIWAGVVAWGTLVLVGLVALALERRRGRAVRPTPPPADEARPR